MKVKVKVTLVLDVDVNDSLEEIVIFHIEDNGCPGTREVGRALADLMDKHEKTSTCWACAAQGKNEILEVDGVPIDA